MTTAEQILTGAAEILADPNHWYKGYYTPGNVPLQEAEKFCVLGACGKAYGLIETREINEARHRGPLRRAEEALRAVGGEAYPRKYQYEVSHLAGQFSVTDWNDDEQLQHPEMLAMVEKARAYAAEKGL